jgi:UDP-3-O-acyl-N-acetylglucosamine deacetylase
MRYAYYISQQGVGKKETIMVNVYTIEIGNIEIEITPSELPIIGKFFN